MSDKVTAVEKSEKTKDPRKVELGKKLAKISKEAKERKARQCEAVKCDLEQSEKNERSFTKEINDYVDFKFLVGGVTIVAVLGGLYYAYKSDKRSESELSERERIDRRSQKQSFSDSASEVQSERDINRRSQATKLQDKKVKTINNEFEINKCKPSTKLSCIENL